jgi:hypothetical protein
VKTRMWTLHVRAFFMILFAALALSACLFVRAPSPSEMQQMESPPAEIRSEIDRIFPAAFAWYAQTETQLLQRGRTLTDPEARTARAVGVQNPDRIRVIVLADFPLPEHAELRAHAARLGLGSALEGGRAMGYAIMVKPRYAQDRSVLTHEFVHVAQRERLGADTFLRRYLTELEIVGYARAPLELEAYEKQSLTH